MCWRNISQLPVAIIQRSLLVMGEYSITICFLVPNGQAYMHSFVIVLPCYQLTDVLYNLTIILLILQ